MERTDLIINSVPLGHQHPINPSLFPSPGGGREIFQGSVEFGQLVNGLVPNQSLPDEQDLVGRVGGHQLGQGTHQRLSVMKAGSTAS